MVAAVEEHDDWWELISLLNLLCVKVYCGLVEFCTGLRIPV
jgi:hypothetical protein